MDLCEFKTSLVYRVNSRTGSKATQRNPVPKTWIQKERCITSFLLTRLGIDMVDSLVTTTLCIARLQLAPPDPYQLIYIVPPSLAKL